MWCIVAEASFQNVSATLAHCLTSFSFLISLQTLSMLVTANYSPFIPSKFQHCRQLLINNLRYFHSTECIWFHDLLHESTEKRNPLPQGTIWITWGIRNLHGIFLAPDLVDISHGEALSPFHSFFISDDCLSSRWLLPWARPHSSFGSSVGWSSFVVAGAAMGMDSAVMGWMQDKCVQRQQLPWDRSQRCLFFHVDGRLAVNEWYGHKLSRGVQIDRVLIK